MVDASQLDRIEAKVDRVEKHLRELNGKVASHDQTIHGPHGHGGLSDDVRSLLDTVRPQGTVAVKTMWTAVGALTAIASVIAALVIGFAT